MLHAYLDLGFVDGGDVEVLVDVDELVNAGALEDVALSVARRDDEAGHNVPVLPTRHLHHCNRGVRACERMCACVCVSEETISPHLQQRQEKERRERDRGRER